jgi:hypothetical protein
MNQGDSTGTVLIGSICYPCSESYLFNFHSRLYNADLAQLNIQLVSLDGGTTINQHVSSFKTKFDTNQLTYGYYPYSIELNHFSIKPGQFIIVN